MSNNLARPKLLIPVQEIASEVVDKGAKKPADVRIQKLNTILGPRGIRADELLRKFDALAAVYKPGVVLPVYLNVIVDNKGKSLEYTMSLGLESTSAIVKRKLKLEKLASKPNLKTPINTVDRKFIEEIISEKFMHTPSTLKPESLFKCIIGTLKSFGIKYIEE